MSTIFLHTDTHTNVSFYVAAFSPVVMTCLPVRMSLAEEIRCYQKHEKAHYFVKNVDQVLVS